MLVPPFSLGVPIRRRRAFLRAVFLPSFLGDEIRIAASFIPAMFRSISDGFLQVIQRGLQWRNFRPESEILNERYRDSSTIRAPEGHCSVSSISRLRLAT